MPHDMLTVKSIPIRCLIEVRSEEKACSFSTGSVPPETESFAIVPSNSLFRDVVKTVLTKLGYSAQDSANAKGKMIRFRVNMHLSSRATTVW